MGGAIVPSLCSLRKLRARPTLRLRRRSGGGAPAGRAKVGIDAGARAEGWSPRPRWGGGRPCKSVGEGKERRVERGRLPQTVGYA
eukprot:7548054-Heterocapsa_arctica.AAC.1